MGRVKDSFTGYSGSSNEITSDYFQWLCDLVCVNEPDHSYWLLADQLQKTVFYWYVPNDENRAADGEKLREIFADETFYNDYTCLQGPVSVFEVFVALAIRMENVLADPSQGDRTVNWFWEMIENLNLAQFDDEHYVERHGNLLVHQILQAFLERKYGRNGCLFPLKKGYSDQRLVEIWYQMMAYLTENYNIDC